MLRMNGHPPGAVEAGKSVLPGQWKDELSSSEISSQLSQGGLPMRLSAAVSMLGIAIGGQPGQKPPDAITTPCG